jgi:lipopolysaccharide cholinephosphotransferase
MGLNQIQDVLYNILCDVDDICKKHNVDYWLCGGTLIGAVRHKGFIPWDDDIDIVIKRKDLDNLKTCLKLELPEYLKFVEPADGGDAFFDFVYRVKDVRYFLHDETEEDNYYGKLYTKNVGIDIFVLDEVSNTKFGTKLLVLWDKILYGLAMGHRYKIEYDKYTLLLKWQIYFLSSVGKKMKMQTILKWHYNANAGNLNKQKRYLLYTNDLINVIGKNCQDVRWYDETIYLDFRNRKFPAPKSYHEILTLRYGDYMTPVKDETIYIKHYK